MGALDQAGLTSPPHFRSRQDLPTNKPIKLFHDSVAAQVGSRKIVYLSFIEIEAKLLAWKNNLVGRLVRVMPYNFDYRSIFPQ